MLLLTRLIRHAIIGSVKTNPNPKEKIMTEQRFSLNEWQHLVKEHDPVDPNFVLSWCGIKRPASEATNHDSTEPWILGCFKCLAMAKLSLKEG